MTPTDTTRTDPAAGDPAHDRLRRALHGAAAGLDLHAPGEEAVRRTAAHRSRRQQRVTAGIASVAVVAGGFGVAGLLSEPGVDFEEGAVGASPSGITFSWVDGEQVLSSQPQIVQAPDGVLYALSTAPGVTYEDGDGGAPLPQAIYRSTDGIAWEATELDADLTLATLDVREDGVLYALSTAPATADVQVATSADGGETWQVEPIPAAGPAPVVADGIVLTSGGTQMDIATDGTTSVVTMQRRWWVQADGLVAPGEEERSWLIPTTDGLELYREAPIDQPSADAGAPPAAAGGEGVSPEPATPDPAAEPAADAPAPVESAPPAIAAEDAIEEELRRAETEPQLLRTIPWAEVGLTGPQDLVVADTFTAVDGGGWTPVSLPLPGMTAHIEPTAEGFVAVLHRQSSEGEVATPLQVARSTDGLTWTLDSAPMGEAVYVHEVGTIGDRVVVSGVAAVTSSPDHDETIVVSSSADAGRTWTTTDLTGLVPPAGEGEDAFIGTWDVGPLGFAASVSTVAEETGDLHSTALLYSPDGTRWDVIDVEEFDAMSQGISWLSVEADRIILSTWQPDQTMRTVVGIPTR